MHFGVSIPNNQGVESVKALVDVASRAEAAGFDSVWVSEHLFHSSYIAERLGDAPYHEALTVLTAIAMQTERVKLGTSVLVLPWHHPARLAKTVATIDELSGGRVILGIGVALTEDEYAALGVSFTERGKIADEMLVAMKALWTQSRPQFKGDYFDFSGLAFAPKPVQQPHPPIWVGGSSAVARRRLAAHGDGWHPLRLSPRQLSQQTVDLRQRLSDAQRDTDVPIAVRLLLSFDTKKSDRPLEEWTSLRGSLDDMRALLDAYREAGVTHIIVDAALRDTQAVSDTYARFLNEVVG